MNNETEFIITLKQLRKLEEIVKQACQDTNYDDAPGATDDWDHVYETKYFHLETWVNDNLRSR